jgi:general secretion pathway protein D
MRSDNLKPVSKMNNAGGSSPRTKAEGPIRGEHSDPAYKSPPSPPLLKGGWGDLLFTQGASRGCAGVIIFFAVILTLITSFSVAQEKGTLPPRGPAAPTSGTVRLPSPPIATPEKGPVPTPPAQAAPTAPVALTAPTVTPPPAAAPAAAAPSAPPAATTPSVTPAGPGAPTPPPAPTEGAQAAPPGGPEMVYLNVSDQDIKDVIRQISKATGKNFIIDDKVRGKVTILSEKMMTKEEAYQTFLSALEVAGFTVVTGPAGIIKIVPLKDALSSPIPIHVDSTPYTDSFVTRLISLTNISAVDMSNAIKGLISKEGNLFAYPATNTLIITDSGTNIDRLMKIIKELDQEGPQQVVEIIPIHYADSKQIAETVLNLFEIEKAKAAKAPAPRRGEATLEEVEEVSKIIADDRTNSVIVLASKRSIDKIKDLIARLDVEMRGETGAVHVHYLKYANAEALAATLSAVTSGGGVALAAAKGEEKGKGAAAKPGAGPIAKLEGGITIGADKTTNALIITASPKDYQTLVDELISKLDIPRRQVFLESIVMELTLSKDASYGASAFGGGGNGSVLGFGQSFGAVGQLFNPTSLFNTGGLLGGVLGRDQITITVPVTGGGTQDVKIPAFSAFLNLIQTYSDANVVSTPNILTLDNEEASIDVKRKEYAASTTTTATGVISTTPTPLEAGLTLKITPQISEGNMVRLKIEHELSNFEKAPAGAIASPTRSRKISTTVMTMDGQTVVLGGLMEDQVSHTKQKIPILGDIPIIGLLFSQTTSAKFKSNMLIFITPHVIKDPSDFSGILQTKINQRNKFIDDNYGKRQERAIRETIAAHRADLLEYTPPPPSAVPPAQPPGAVETPKAPDATVVPEETKRSKDLSSAKSYKKEPSRPPSASPPPKKLEELDLAY